MATNNAVNVNLNGQSGTGAFAGTVSPSFTTPALGTPSALVVTNATGDKLGTTTNDNAAALHVGEIVTSTVASGSGVSMANGTAMNVTSISLTAGDWDVEGNVGATISGACTTLVGWISTTSASAPDASAYAGPNQAGILDRTGFAVPYKRISIASTTTVYLSAVAVFTTGANTGYGSITARRAR